MDVGFLSPVSLGWKYTVDDGDGSCLSIPEWTQHLGLRPQVCPLQRSTSEAKNRCYIYQCLLLLISYHIFVFVWFSATWREKMKCQKMYQHFFPYDVTLISVLL